MDKLNGKMSEVDDRQAAAITGLSSAELRSLAREAALGQSSDDGQRWFFTFEDLRRLSLLAHSEHL